MAAGEATRMEHVRARTLGPAERLFAMTAFPLALSVTVGGAIWAMRAGLEPALSIGPFQLKDVLGAKWKEMLQYLLHVVLVPEGDGVSQTNDADGVGGAAPFFFWPRRDAFTPRGGRPGRRNW